MASGSYSDAHGGGVSRSFCEQLRERVPPEEEFSPLRYLHLGQRRGHSLYFISAALPER